MIGIMMIMINLNKLNKKVKEHVQKEEQDKWDMMINNMKTNIKNMDNHNKKNKKIKDKITMFLNNMLKTIKFMLFKLKINIQLITITRDHL